MIELLKKYIGKKVVFHSTADGKCTSVISGILYHHEDASSLPWEVHRTETCMVYFEFEVVESAIEREDDLMIWAKLK